MIKQIFFDENGVLIFQEITYKVKHDEFIEEFIKKIKNKKDSSMEMI